MWGRSLVDSYGTGTGNSTTAGAAQGMIMNDAILRGNQNLLSAIDFSNQTGRANLGANLDTMGSIANLLYPMGAAANANLMTALGSRDNFAMANAQAENAANLQYSQAMQAYNQQKQSGLGSLIGGGIGLLAAPFTGGMSLGKTAQSLGSVLGGSPSFGGGLMPTAQSGGYFNPGAYFAKQAGSSLYGGLEIPTF
jgi:hypothetical protein